MQRAINLILGDRVGGVVAMDPRDGSILALVSEPGFDPNLFAPSGADRSGWDAILNDPDHPLLNRPVHNAYVPGSTFKLATFLAAGKAGLLYPGRTWLCQGRIEVGDRFFNCWNRGGHGVVDSVRAVAESCDVTFWLMAQELGHDPIADMAKEIGFGAPTGIDLPAERGGLIPDEEWKMNRWGERWYTGDTLNMAIGQGFVQVNLLQEARVLALVANGGYLVPPHVNQLLTPDRSSLQKLDISDSVISQLRQGLRQAVATGTARACNLGWIEIAGKTGTADDPPRPDPHSWFISFGPYSDPKLALVVFLENGGHGDEKAAPLAAQIWNCDEVKAYLAE
jgi:penicillin-binding protein 2